MAQSHRLKKASPLESSLVKVDDHLSQFSARKNQNINGGSIRFPGGASNVKILSKAKDHSELNGGNRVGKQNRAVGAVSYVRR